jgi:hypothetical protein
MTVVRPLSEKNSDKDRGAAIRENRRRVASVRTTTSPVQGCEVQT